MKQDTPILVILGNPPYNGFAGMAVEEERELSDAYRTTKRVRRPEGQGLNDLYVRFFRMAERRIAEKTGQGIVCFISNYSWLDGLSFTGMRERYLGAFDRVRIDNLHGDRIISEYAPDGRTSETVFALQGQSPGIKVGTSIALFSKLQNSLASAARHVQYRDFHQARAVDRREALLESLEAPDIDTGYSTLQPELHLGLPFKPVAVSEEWFDWPALPDLFPVSFPGVKTDRDWFLVDIDLDRLKARIADYFDPALSHEEIARRYPAAMRNTTSVQLDARAVRDALLARSGPNEAGFMRCVYRPFDNRWLYWEAESGLLARPRSDYRSQVFEGNMWLSAAQHLRKGAAEAQTCFVRHIGQLHLIERSASLFPAWLCDDRIGSDGNSLRNPGSWPPDHAARGIGSNDDGPCNPGAELPSHPVRRVGSDEDGPRSRPNLSGAARRYLEHLGLSVEDLFHHVLAVLHDPAYREANAGALRMEWPRIPLPGWPTPRNAHTPPTGTAAITDRGSVSGPANGTSGDCAPADTDSPPATDRRSEAEGPPDPGTRAPSPATERSSTLPDREAAEAARALAQSAARGRELACLLDSDQPVPGVTSGRLRPEIAAIAVPATTDGRNMTGGDFALTAGWGHYGTGGAVMPGQGRIVERACTPDERAAMGDALPVLGETTFDVYLNGCRSRIDTKKTS